MTRRPGLGRYSWIEDLGHGHESDLVRSQGERFRLDRLKSGFQFSQLGLSSSTTNTIQSNSIDRAGGNNSCAWNFVALAT